MEPIKYNEDDLIKEFEKDELDKITSKKKKRLKKKLKKKNKNQEN